MRHDKYDHPHISTPLDPWLTVNVRTVLLVRHRLVRLENPILLPPILHINLSSIFIHLSFLHIAPLHFPLIHLLHLNVPPLFFLSLHGP